MVCATSRTGSTYLCQLLASTRLLGNPREYFNGGQRRRNDPAYPDDRRAQLDMIRTRATGNGIYAVKVLGPQLPREGDVDPLRDLPNLSLVRIRRADARPGHFAGARPPDRPIHRHRSATRGAPAYDAGAIRHGLRSIERQEAIWDAALAQLGVQPLPITYEDIAADPQAVVDRIAAHLGLAMPAKIDQAVVTHTMQRDGQSAEWRARFLAESGDELLARR